MDHCVFSGEIVKVRAKMTYKRDQAKSSPSKSLYEGDKADSSDAEFRVVDYVDLGYSRSQVGRGLICGQTAPVLDTLWQRLNQTVSKRNLSEFTSTNAESLQRTPAVIRTLRSTKLTELEVKNGS